MFKIKNKIILIGTVIFLSVHSSAFAYKTTEPQNIKVSTTYSFTNHSSNSIAGSADLSLINKSKSLYSQVLDEKITARSVIEENVDERMNRVKRISVDDIPSQETKDGTYEYLVRLSKIDYELSPNKTNKIGNYSEKIKKYLKPTKKVESNNPYIKEEAKKIKNSLPFNQRGNPYYVTKKIYEYTYQNIAYTYDAEYRNKGALHALTYKVGNCEDYSSLMVALLRANYIPARTVSGYRISSNDIKKSNMFLAGTSLNNNLKDSRYARHMWVEAYINGYGWVAFDPTLTTMVDSKVIIYNHLTNEDKKSTKKFVEAYIPVTFTYDNYFGKLNDYYIPESYDFYLENYQAMVTNREASFSLDFKAANVEQNKIIH